MIIIDIFNNHVGCISTPEKVNVMSDKHVYLNLFEYYIVQLISSLKIYKDIFFVVIYLQIQLKKITIQ